MNNAARSAPAIIIAYELGIEAEICKRHPRADFRESFRSTARSEVDDEREATRGRAEQTLEEKNMIRWMVHSECDSLC